MELYRLSASEMARGIKKGEFTALEVTNSCLSRIDDMEPSLHAMITVCHEEARSRASEIDGKIASGEETGVLAGVPVILKDNMCTKGTETTCASKILKGWKPPYDATVVRLLHSEGAVILGKANMDEFAMGGSTENSAFGVTANPWDLDRVPGGSSGGSAAAVAAGYAPIALGSDTGGSIRQPAAFCGIYGLKPTYGRVSRYGLVAFASSLDQIGPFTRTAEDIALVMDVIGVADDLRDSTSEPVDPTDYSEALSRSDLKGKKIGVIKEIADYDYDERIKTAIAQTVVDCEEAGAEIVEISLSAAIEYGMACYYVLAPAEASSNLARYDGVRYGMAEEADSLMGLYLKTRKEGFGEEVKRRILTGTYVLSAGFYDAYYLKAQKVRKVIKEEFAKAFKEVDTILLPASPTPAFKIGELIDDPIAMYMADVFTIPVNMAGLPGITMNRGFSEEGLPLGVQFIGPRWGEAELLGTVKVLEGKYGPARIAEGGSK